MSRQYCICLIIVDNHESLKVRKWVKPSVYWVLDVEFSIHKYNQAAMEGISGVWW